MTKLELIERLITSLSSAELDELREWILHPDGAAWDAQIARDIRAGRLDELARRALEDYNSGHARDL